MFKNIKFVLIQTTHPGNMGAAARSLKNMGFEHLFLVAPLKFPDEEAIARASGAKDVLERAVVCQNLEEAIGDCQLVFGLSARE
jgi:tRNA C32,U32 (ribose-2'-O)-methylase TrmJ